MKKHTNNKSGFTLVELAIVLVIIGLIVGGVLVGADLIKAATLNKATKQISDTDAAANTFRTKYNELPGDVRNATTIFPGRVTDANATLNTLGKGNGDALIQATTTAAGGTATTRLGVSGESGVFFTEIAASGYVKEAMGNVDISDIAPTAANINATDATARFLPSALGRGAKLIAGSDGSVNYITIVGNAAADASVGVADFAGALSPLQASQFDVKLDDGIATTGNVRTMTLAQPIPGTAEALGANLCATTGGVYNSGTTSTTLLCNISIRGSF